MPIGIAANPNVSNVDLPNPNILEVEKLVESYSASSTAILIGPESRRLNNWFSREAINIATAHKLVLISADSSAGIVHVKSQPKENNEQIEFSSHSATATTRGVNRIKVVGESNVNFLNFEISYPYSQFQFVNEAKIEAGLRQLQSLNYIALIDPADVSIAPLIAAMNALDPQFQLASEGCDVHILCAHHDRVNGAESLLECSLNVAQDCSKIQISIIAPDLRGILCQRHLNLELLRDKRALSRELLESLLAAIIAGEPDTAFGDVLAASQL